MFGKITTAALVLEGSLLVSAFPHIAKQVAEQRKVNKRAGLPTGAVPFPEYPGSPAHATYDKFDPSSQLVSTSGDHAWMAPGPGDIRGPCAGLNAAANHGYLQRSGVVDSESINTGLWEAFGLDHTATIFLETATRFFDGDPISGKWSIGYHSPDTSSLGPLDGLAGDETGICVYGHLKTEGDASITRGDFLAPEMNSNCHSYPEFAQELLDLATKRTGGNITPQVLAEHQYNRKLHSIANNPNYFSPAYAGVAFTFGAHMFAYELLANHSAEDPRGILTPETFMSFFSYTKDDNGNLVYTPGQERIPDNWYKRADDDAWTLDDIVLSTAQNCASYPLCCQVGGNTGEVNSFDGVDPSDITGGLINSFEDLSDPDRMSCFIAQAVQADAPSFLDGVFTGAALQTVTGMLSTVLQPALQPLMGSCPNLPPGKSVMQYGAKYPGAKIQNSGPRDPSES